jgi:hypothetical protein
MFAPIKIKEIRALKDHVLVSNMNFKERVTSGGIQLLSDDGRSAGVRPRWAQIYATGPDQTDVHVGQWVLVKHGRWTRGVTVETVDGEYTLRRVDARDILLMSDTEPASDDTQSQEKLIDAKDRW